MATILMEKDNDFGSSESKEEEELVSIAYETHLIRVQAIAAAGASEEPPQLAVVATMQQLFEYTETFKEALGLNMAYGDAFNHLTEKYNDAFFQTKALVLLLINENSGSISHEINVGYDGQQLNINIIRCVPEGFLTADMARWLAVVELDADYVENNISVKIL